MRLSTPPSEVAGTHTVDEQTRIHQAKAAVLAQEHLSQAGAALGVGVAMLLNAVGRLIGPNSWPAPLRATVLETIAREGGLVRDRGARAVLLDQRGARSAAGG